MSTGYRAFALFGFTDCLLGGPSEPDALLERVLAEADASAVELDAAQHFRSFPLLADSEVEATREAAARFGVDILALGVYLDLIPSPTVRLADDEAEAQLGAQLRAASRLGAACVRIALGAVPEGVIRRVLPDLEALDLVLAQEIQGAVRPDSAALESQLRMSAELGPDRLRFVLDTSVIMPELPPTYLAALAATGVSGAVVGRLVEAWGDPRAVAEAVWPLVHGGRLGHAARSLLVTAVTRFGSSAPADWSFLLGQVTAVHAKFWDLEHEDAVAKPLRGIFAEGYEGPVLSEWGGHEWLRGHDPLGLTLRHMDLIEQVRQASSHEGAGS